MAAVMLDAHCPSAVAACHTACTCEATSRPRMPPTLLPRHTPTPPGLARHQHSIPCRPHVSTAIFRRGHVCNACSTLSGGSAYGWRDSGVWWVAARGDPAPVLLDTGAMQMVAGGGATASASMACGVTSWCGAGRVQLGVRAGRVAARGAWRCNTSLCVIFTRKLEIKTFGS